MHLLTLALLILFFTSVKVFAFSETFVRSEAKLAYLAFQQSSSFNFNSWINGQKHIQFVSCSVETNDSQAYKSNDLGACIFQDYFEQRSFMNDRALTLNYLHDNQPHQLKIFWRPNCDDISIEIKKLRDEQKEVGLQAQMCSSKKIYSQVQDPAFAQQKYLRLKRSAISSSQMRSTFGNIKLVSDQSGELANVVGLPDNVSSLLGADKVTELDFDVVLDPTDFGNFISKLDFYSGSMRTFLTEVYFQYKPNMKCEDFHFEVDPNE